MSILVLTNVGSRDVTLGGEDIRPARVEGKRLLDEYETHAPQLTFPIIEPVVRYILARHPRDDVLLFLFGTDQPDARFQPTDTLHFAHLLARRLPEIFGERVSARSIDVQGFNPSYYDLALDSYDRLLAGFPEKDIEVCYVALAGGVPACNTALLLQGVRRYGDRLQVIYTPVGEEPVPIRAGQQILNSFREAATVERIRQLDFANALPLLQSLGMDPGICFLAEYAARRLDFDFLAAQELLENALAQGDDETKQFIQKSLRHDLDVLVGGEDPLNRLAVLLRELNWNAAICWRHHRFADFLARVYRFQEAVLRFLVERFFGLPTDISKSARESTTRAWEEGIQAIPGLIEYFQTLSPKGEEIDWHMNSRVTYKALLGFAKKNGGSRLNIKGSEPSRFAALVDRVNALDRLVDLRHRTVVGHDFIGVSEHSILEASPRTKNGIPLQPDQALEEIVHLIASVAGLEIILESPYEQIAAFLLSRLQKGQ